MSDETQLRLIIAALGVVWIGWIVWSHRRRRTQGERLGSHADSRRGKRRLEPSLDDESRLDPDFDGDARARSAAAAAAIDEARSIANHDSGSRAPDLTAELEKLSREIAGDAPLPLGIASSRGVTARARVEPTFGSAGVADPIAARPIIASREPAPAASQSAGASARPPHGERAEGDYDRLVSLFVVASPGEEISGYELVVATEKCGLEFGARDVYHRLVEGRPEAGPVFSLANMTKPGSFDLATITGLSTPGLTFFMTLPGPMRALDAWDTMLPTAQRMAELLGAQLLDEEHNALGRQRIQHIRDELRAYDRTLERQTIKRSW